MHQSTLHSRCARVGLATKSCGAGREQGVACQTHWLFCAWNSFREAIMNRWKCGGAEGACPWELMPQRVLWRPGCATRQLTAVALRPTSLQMPSCACSMVWQSSASSMG